MEGVDFDMKVFVCGLEGGMKLLFCLMMYGDVCEMARKSKGVVSERRFLQWLHAMLCFHAVTLLIEVLPMCDQGFGDAVFSTRHVLLMLAPFAVYAVGWLLTRLFASVDMREARFERLVCEEIYGDCNGVPRRPFSWSLQRFCSEMGAGRLPGAWFAEPFALAMCASTLLGVLDVALMK